MFGDKNDYGYFGKGLDGYAHYMQAFNRNFKSSDKRVRNNSQSKSVRKNKPSSTGINTAADVISILIYILIISALYIIAAILTANG